MYKLLIVDDEPTSRSLLSALDWAAVNIEAMATAGNGEEALAYLKENTVDIVLTDIQMPLMDGIQLAQKMEEQYPDIVVIALSAYDDYAYLRQCMKLKNIYDYILKPIDPDEWLAAFQGVVRHLGATVFSPNYSHVSTSKKYIIKSALDYIQKNYQTSITLMSAAEHIHVSHTYLSRVLKDELQIGFPDLLNTCRLDRAKKLLEDSQYKINEIAEMTGYGSPQYFTHIFKKHYGVTPQEYRSRIK